MYKRYIKDEDWSKIYSVLKGIHYIRVASIFSNDESRLRLVTGILMETSEEWVPGKVYMKIE